LDGRWIHLPSSNTWWSTALRQSLIVVSWLERGLSSGLSSSMYAVDFFLQKKDFWSLWPQIPQSTHLLQHLEKCPLILHFEQVLDQAGHFFALVDLWFLWPWLWFAHAQHLPWGAALVFPWGAPFLVTSDFIAAVQSPIALFVALPCSFWATNRPL